MSDLSAITDETLMRHLMDGDPFAIESIYDRHSRKLYSLALRITGDAQSAEEIIQDTFFQLWRKSSQFDPERGSLIGWLLTMTRHRAIGRIREQKGRVQCELPLTGSTQAPSNLRSDFLDQEIARQLVSAAFAGLPENQRHAISLAYFDGFTCEEIASRTQTPAGTIKTRLRSALRTMKRMLSEPIASRPPDWQHHLRTLNGVLITEQLSSRGCRGRDSRQEMKARETLKEALTASPHQFLDALLQMPLDLCHAGTGGLSLLETDSQGNQVFRWTNLSGVLAKHVGGTTPRNFSPCGVTLDFNSPQLFEYPARYFDYFKNVDVPIVEGLVIPFHAGNKTEGTIWIVSHDQSLRFDREDVRIMASIADFAGCALHLNRFFDAAGQWQPTS